MAHSFSRVAIHAVFSTKYRRPSIAASVRPALEQFQARILRELDCRPLEIGGIDDHNHVLFEISRQHSIARVVQELKHGSSLWMKSNGTRDPKFRWQTGYAAFSVSPGEVRRVSRYIANQAEHHQKHAYQAELRAALQRFEIPYDESIWD